MHTSLVEILYYLRTAGPLTLVHSVSSIQRKGPSAKEHPNTQQRIGNKTLKSREDSEAAQTALRFSSVLQALSFSWVNTHQPSEMVHLGEPHGWWKN